EEADNPVPLQRIALPGTAELTSQFEAAMLDGVTVVRGEALVEDDTGWIGRLYRAWPTSSQPHTITAIPYYAWDNRQPGEMRVWIRERP
ncbi:MAG TPA: glycoside hydrolase family 127 protein, partial [Ktedonobacteraceae bacterium]|nr:glycoside hydrolase family 127 protein [Ktedonobacteraceae bacterium]